MAGDDNPMNDDQLSIAIGHLDDLCVRQVDRDHDRGGDGDEYREMTTRVLIDIAISLRVISGRR